MICKSKSQTTVFGDFEFYLQRYVHIFLDCQADFFGLGGTQNVTGASRDGQPLSRQNGSFSRCSAHSELWVSAVWLFQR